MWTVRPGKVTVSFVVVAVIVVISGYLMFDLVTSSAPESLAPREPVAAERAPATVAPPPEPTEEGADRMAELGFGHMSQASEDAAARGRAEGLFRDALWLEPLHAGATFGLGWAAQAADDDARAERYYLSAERLARNEPGAGDIEYFIHFNLYFLYEGTGRTAAATLERSAAERLTPHPGEVGFDEEATARFRAVYDLARLALARIDATDPEAQARFASAMETWRSGDDAGAQAFLLNLIAGPAAESQAQ